ncbi:hypothetical protein A2524_04055 [Candidatus Wolfebacteria bacterium RIFOXYD12_FULL_48_21]|uniref:HTH hxlR-type domain-containing protein n=1 Tax=Candidatus Wolfebacteria bacterium RIFOXYD1_FULL_48_65 TaxID=1802561 RepID=A0A1F8DZ60_9BACT|nr:MAG: hypothetical protein A2610_01615 [Candidatus Wolfebacteria bacterium RIFOXYD1_FULL_48_65]OGM95216.1 MAG: hypothetical protein A2524_04055 [Candidatus Wolfebacteria bacterium RIFOXYD12_FULL_48_21]OGM96403.1 MAG: hypothetical protein A2532_00720 [Candidatus Wolfebacteria bacterium RIFOXYD2_FULL_48_11]
MISNYEFIKTQAYEISWAVFRCAELFSQAKLRGEVEAAAVDLIADHAVANSVADGDFPRIDKLTSLIRLAESVGQIAPVNANVLYRELDNLTKALRIEVAEQHNKKNITASLEQIFTNTAYANNLQPITNNQQQNSGLGDSARISSATSASPIIPTLRQDKDTQFGSVEALLSAAVRPAQLTPAPMQKAPIVRQPLTPVSSATASVQAGSWQFVILQKVKDLGQTTTKELTASFPEISERTIRFYLQKLVDNGSIDRIGSSGPGSAYRAKG